MGKKNKVKKYNAMLRRYLSKREIVKISRTVTNGEANVYGIITGLSERFMFLAEKDDFKFNGEIIIPTYHYDSMRCSDYEKTSKKILKAEKQLSSSKPKSTKIDLSTWKSVFLSLMKSDIHVIIECEDLKKPTFTIGPIERINNKSVAVRYYDPNGRLDKKPTKIKFKNITLVRFNDEYSKTFRKYLKQPKRKK